MFNELQRFELYKQLNPNELTAQQFTKIQKEIKKPKIGTTSDEYFDFKLWNLGLPSRQERFATFIANKLSKNNGAKILEVGCGRTARLSRFLSAKGFEMTCIDPNLELDNSYNIEFIKETFDYNYDLSKYDYVIAQEPCDATEHIVRACINQNVPFMMSLCGVPHKLISGKMPENVYEWYEYLQNISPDKLKLRYLSLDPLATTPILRSNKF